MSSLLDTRYFITIILYKSSKNIFYRVERLLLEFEYCLIFIIYQVYTYTSITPGFCLNFK